MAEPPRVTFPWLVAASRVTAVLEAVNGIPHGEDPGRFRPTIIRDVAARTDQLEATINDTPGYMSLLSEAGFGRISTDSTVVHDDPQGWVTRAGSPFAAIQLATHGTSFPLAGKARRYTCSGKLTWPPAAVMANTMIARAMHVSTVKVSEYLVSRSLPASDTDIARGRVSSKGLPHWPPIFLLYRVLQSPGGAFGSSLQLHEVLLVTSKLRMQKGSDAYELAPGQPDHGPGGFNSTITYIPWLESPPKQPVPQGPSLNDAVPELMTAGAIRLIRALDSQAADAEQLRAANASRRSMQDPEGTGGADGSEAASSAAASTSSSQLQAMARRKASFKSGAGAPEGKPARAFSAESRRAELLLGAELRLGLSKMAPKQLEWLTKLVQADAKAAGKSAHDTKASPTAEHSVQPAAMAAKTETEDDAPEPGDVGMQPSDVSSVLEGWLAGFSSWGMPLIGRDDLSAMDLTETWTRACAVDMMGLDQAEDSDEPDADPADGALEGPQVEGADDDQAVGDRKQTDPEADHDKAAGSSVEPAAVEAPSTKRLLHTGADIVSALLPGFSRAKDPTDERQHEARTESPDMDAKVTADGAPPVQATSMAPQVSLHSFISTNNSKPAAVSDSTAEDTDDMSSETQAGGEARGLPLATAEHGSQPATSHEPLPTEAASTASVSHTDATSRSQDEAAAHDSRDPESQSQPLPDPEARKPEQLTRDELLACVDGLPADCEAEGASATATLERRKRFTRECNLEQCVTM
jgi:hypothetical protein